MSIADNVRRVREQISEAASRSGRKASDITLVAVTKSFPPEVMLEGYAAGLRHFGENRVQEAENQIRSTQASTPQAHWHLIGHLQRNKAKAAVEWFSLIHSVDSLRVAQAISQHCLALGKRLPVLLEVNISGEATKSGFGLTRDRAAFWRDAESIVALSSSKGGIQPLGLMTVAPYSANAEDARPVFAALRALRDELAARFGGAAAWPALSMGMSGDFVVAIEEGATFVRIGTALFGERTAKH
ncbi:MAG: YggS family pyridoxal phosphate-dependent enzyme [Chloroflexi bacterium]|nr:YggS family pyridoxal phosphate-dependent enzyme [Chloroflexota bacterium]MBI3733501.1 YggS family pyridoxal phosphate-dependent enzyme [Chloroflexota bacterium]